MVKGGSEADLDRPDVADVLDVFVDARVQGHVLGSHSKALPVLALIAATPRTSTVVEGLGSCISDYLSKSRGVAFIHPHAQTVPCALIAATTPCTSTDVEGIRKAEAEVVSVAT